MKRHDVILTVAVAVLGIAVVLSASNQLTNNQLVKPTQPVEVRAMDMLEEGRQTFRFDTFGDETFWGDTLRLHEAINGLTPNQALALGLKVDVEALGGLANDIQQGKVNLDDPAATRVLIQRQAVLGVVGQFNADGTLRTVGLTCALCHSTVNNSLAAGIGQRLDGWANRDLNVGGIVAAAPNLDPIVGLLRIAIPTIDAATVRAVLNSWGPGKYDAELLFDGKAFTPDGKPAATMLPNAYGLSGHNLHTWTGGWGTVSYWNALVGVLLLRGNGTFFDPRMDNAAQFPIAAAARLGHVSVPPDQDRVTGKLPALHFYQLALPAPRPTAGVDFNADAAARGATVFTGKADCNRCHRTPLWTEPGWNAHTPAEMKIESFQADRSPDHTYRTMGLAGLFVRERGLFMRAENKGRFYHDGRFATLRDVVASYNQRFGLLLTVPEQLDLVEYLKSL
ncbi:MAG: hypothetical protein HZC54_08360 [Verrucomicrobia bacterium]|nr:hypothetical protein [Verrucomicrobiota bacterium]